MALNTPIRDWSRQRVWVIGASSGIGAALSAALIERGARVALSARRRAPLEDIARSRPAHALVEPLDVTHEGAVAAALERILAAWGEVTLVLYVAGTHAPQRAWDIEPGEARDIVAANLLGVLDGLPAVVRRLMEQGHGALGIVSSVAGYRGLPQALVYGATKAALINLAETLYLDLAPKGIGVYLINPGFVRTPLTDQNEFKMPALIEPPEAAREILRGLERGEFEIHFPKRFTRVMKLLRLLPYRWYFYLVHKVTGL